MTVVKGDGWLWHFRDVSVWAERTFGSSLRLKFFRGSSAFDKLRGRDDGNYHATTTAVKAKGKSNGESENAGVPLLRTHNKAMSGFGRDDVAFGAGLRLEE